MIELTWLDLINEYIFITLLTRDAWGVRLCVCVCQCMCVGVGEEGVIIKRWHRFQLRKADAIVQ